MPPLCKGRGTALAVEGLFFSLNSLSSRKVYRVSRSDTRKLVELFHRKCSLSQSEYSHSLVQSSIATQNLSYSFGKTCGGVFRRKTEGLFAQKTSLTQISSCLSFQGEVDFFKCCEAMLEKRRRGISSYQYMIYCK